jgi:hypothetical protein
MNAYAYFMIRVRRNGQDAPPAAIAGIIERLGSGEKQEFDGGDELLRLVAGWSDGSPNLRSGMEIDNAPPDGGLTEDR